MKNFSIDLIYGIPGQTMDSWRDTLSGITNFSPAHISTYELTPEKNTSLFRLIKEQKISMPDEDLILDMYNHTIDYLENCGYEHYEISNFAKPGCESKHNRKYWRRKPVLAAGCGACTS